MNQLNTLKTGILQLATVTLFALSLAGCATPLVHVSNAVFNFGQELPEDMVNRNIAAVVGFDEAWADTYNRPSRTALYSQGIVPDTPEYALRVARVNLSHTDEMLYISKGELVYPTGAVVPDHLPQLKAWDIVEVRQTGTYRTMENFVAKQDGNIVVRILCRKADPNYEACRDAAPRIGEYKGVGATGTSYPATASEYGYTFTPMFDVKGNPLRSYPEVK